MAPVYMFTDGTMMEGVGILYATVAGVDSVETAEDGLWTRAFFITDPVLYKIEHSKWRSIFHKLR
jgi:hypothetical protein